MGKDHNRVCRKEIRDLLGIQIWSRNVWSVGGWGGKEGKHSVICGWRRGDKMWRKKMTRGGRGAERGERCMDKSGFLFQPCRAVLHSTIPDLFRSSINRRLQQRPIQIQNLTENHHPPMPVCTLIPVSITANRSWAQINQLLLTTCNEHIWANL